MKILFTAGLMACMLALAACASPELPADAADAREAEMAKEFQDDEKDDVLLTGSRIPQKSTSHAMRRIGGKEYKKAAGGGQHNPATPLGGQ